MAEEPTSRPGGNLPELKYFLNNGRDDVTHAEVTELHTVLGKTTFDEGIRRGGDGASFPSLQFDVLECVEGGSGEPERFPGYGEGVSLDDFGLVGKIGDVMVEEDELPAESRSDLPDSRPSCEARRRHGSLEPFNELVDGGYVEEYSVDDDGSWGEEDDGEYPSDHGHW